MAQTKRFARFSLGLGATIATVTSLLVGCTQFPRQPGNVGLDRSQQIFSTGRVDFLIVDEYGIALPRMRVNLEWDEPNFYTTSAFTDQYGQVSFKGVPSLAQVSVDHPGGIYIQKLMVPQSGRPELRVILDTLGGGERLREQERARRAGRTSSPAP